MVRWEASILAKMCIRDRISANHKGSLRVYQRLDGYVAGEGLRYSGGDLRLSTPLLTGEAGSLSRISSGGSLSLAAPAGAAAVTFDSGTAGLGAESVSYTHLSCSRTPSPCRPVRRRPPVPPARFTRRA